MNITIEKLVYGGDGLARSAHALPGKKKCKDAANGGPAEPPEQTSQERGKAIFVPFVLPGEKVEARVTEEKPGFLRARAQQILEPSVQRIEPECPYFGRCGGCQYQHTSYEHQLEIKTSILIETIHRIAKIDLAKAPHVHGSFPWNYRNRTRMRVHGGSKFAIGYYRFGSHDLLPIEKCPISSPMINSALASIWELGRNRAVPGEIEEIEFFADQADTRLLLEFHLGERVQTGISNKIIAFALQLREIFPAVAGISVFRREGNLLVHEHVPEHLRATLGADHMNYHVGECQYRVSAGSFFQTNRHLTDEMVNIVTRDRSGAYALDLYSGVGLFSLPMSQNFREVAAVEQAPFAYHDLRHNSPSNVTGYHASTDYFLTGARDIAQFDYVVVDPPRAGMGETAVRQLAELAPPAITYVSCDPATLARDLRVLLAAGYHIRNTHLLDLFPQTYHIESIFELTMA